MHKAANKTPLAIGAIGFDRIVDMIERSFSGDAQSATYPPYNIEKNEDKYRITLAVAGFSLDDLVIETHDGYLEVRGTRELSVENITFLHRGIAERNFTRKFYLADNVRVTGANLDNGLLTVDLTLEVPEEKKPRKIDISVAGKV